MMILPKQYRDHQQRDHRKRNQQGSFPGRGRVGEQAERSARVLGMGEAEKTGDDLNVRIKRDALRHSVLRPTVKQDNDESAEKINRARGIPGHSYCRPRIWAANILAYV